MCVCVFVWVSVYYVTSCYLPMTLDSSLLALNHKFWCGGRQTSCEKKYRIVFNKNIYFRLFYRPPMFSCVVSVPLFVSNMARIWIGGGVLPCFFFYQFRSNYGAEKKTNGSAYHEYVWCMSPPSQRIRWLARSQSINVQNAQQQQERNNKVGWGEN